ncbi:hypothetical protein [Hahella ganghwensis]|uniref:hypothetical protein n=1 Tax=Hahella ganghwensis TaxID=286420 RepID=UPI00037349A3|nr:hypothetical protein [Hahella ganghwensis]
METKIVKFQKALYGPIVKIAEREKFPKCLSILAKYDRSTEELPLTQEEAQHIVDMLGYEALRLDLVCPYTDDDPEYDDDLADEWTDFVQSIYPHALNCIQKQFEVEE